MKTKTEWFLYLPPAIAQKAIYNMAMYHPDDTTRTSLGSAISGGFGWSSTPEGENYWASMSQGAYDSEFNCDPRPLRGHNEEAYMIGYRANEAFKNEKVSH